MEPDGQGEAATGQPFASRLELTEHPGFQQAIWRFQRLGWSALALFLIAALAGLTGIDGPLARQERTAGFGSADLPTIARRGSDDSILLGLAGTRGTRRITLDAAFVSDFSVLSIQPEPRRSIAQDGGLALWVEAEGPGPNPVRMEFTPLSAGLKRYRIAVDGEAVSATTLVLP